MTKHENERLKALERRMNFLNGRIFTKGESTGDLSFDRAEASALEWAIKELEIHLKVAEPEVKECNHLWAILRDNMEVFCQRCLEKREI